MFYLIEMLRLVLFASCPALAAAMFFAGLCLAILFHAPQFFFERVCECGAVWCCSLSRELLDEAGNVCVIDGSARLCLLRCDATW